MEILENAAIANTRWKWITEFVYFVQYTEYSWAEWKILGILDTINHGLIIGKYGICCVLIYSIVTTINCMYL